MKTSKCKVQIFKKTIHFSFSDLQFSICNSVLPIFQTTKLVLGIQSGHSNLDKIR